MAEPLTDDELKKLRVYVAHADEYEQIRVAVERSQWLGRLMWKTGLVVGGAAAGFVAFKQHLVALFGGK